MLSVNVCQTVLALYGLFIWPRPINYITYALALIQGFHFANPIWYQPNPNPLLSLHHLLTAVTSPLLSIPTGTDCESCTTPMDTQVNVFDIGAPVSDLTV
jgi:hypothetical protein